MSFTKEITIWCDECIEWNQISAYKGAKREFKNMGWVILRDKCYCPKCAKSLNLKTQKIKGPPESGLSLVDIINGKNFGDK